MKRHVIGSLIHSKRFSIFQRKTSQRDGKVNLMQEALKSTEDIVKNVMKDPNKFVPGAYPPFIEATVIREMKVIAISKTKRGLFRDSHLILKNIINCERGTLGHDHPQVANTLYHIGVAQNFMGNLDHALVALQEGIQILYPKRFNIDNMDLAALFYQYAIIQGNKGEFQSALHHLDLARQTEKRHLGYYTEKTISKIADYEYAHEVSDKLVQTISRAA